MRTQREGRGPQVRVLVVARVRLFRDGLVATLRAGGHEVVAEAADLAGALAAVAELEPDAVVIDASRPDALCDIQRLARRGPRPAAIVAVGIPQREGEILACAEAGAAGFVSAGQSGADLVDAVERAARGELACCERTAGALFRRVGELARRTSTAAHAERLTARELEVARLIDRGLTNREIAAELCITHATVKNHAHSILRKLRLENRAEIATALLDEQALPDGLARSPAPVLDRAGASV